MYITSACAASNLFFPPFFQVFTPFLLRMAYNAFQDCAEDEAEAEVNTLCANLNDDLYSQMEIEFGPLPLTRHRFREMTSANFDYFWRVRHSLTPLRPISLPPPTPLREIRYNTPRTLPLGPNRCAAATLKGFRCCHHILHPLTVCEIHARFYLKHLYLPRGGPRAPNLPHINDFSTDLKLDHTTPEMLQPRTIQTTYIVRQVYAQLSA